MPGELVSALTRGPRKGLKRAALLLASVCIVLVSFGPGGSAALNPAAKPTKLLACELTMKLGAPEGTSQRHLELVFTDSKPLVPSSSPCRVSGWPQVELIGPKYPLYGTIYTLPRQSGSAQTVNLKPGESARATLTWLPPEGGPNPRWTPGYIRVVVKTDRGQSPPMALPWPYGAVLRQDDATYPGTYIGPITPDPAA